MNDFIEDNVVEDLVVSDEPEQSQSQRLMVYVPVVKPGEKGIAEFDVNQFLVNDGKVKLRRFVGGGAEYRGSYTLRKYYSSEIGEYTDSGAGNLTGLTSGKYIVLLDFYGHLQAGQYTDYKGTAMTITDLTVTIGSTDELVFYVGTTYGEDGSIYSTGVEAIGFTINYGSAFYSIRLVTPDFDDDMYSEAIYDALFTFIKID